VSANPSECIDKRSDLAIATPPKLNTIFCSRSNPSGNKRNNRCRNSCISIRLYGVRELRQFGIWPLVILNRQISFAIMSSGFVIEQAHLPKPARAAHIHSWRKSRIEGEFKRAVASDHHRIFIEIIDRAGFSRGAPRSHIVIFDVLPELFRVASDDRCYSGCRAECGADARSRAGDLAQLEQAL